MRLEDRQWAGLFLFAATTQFAIIGLTIAEAVYPNPPGYSVSQNHISDLGVGPTAGVFNASIILLGLSVVATSWFLFRGFKDRFLTIALLLAGVGSVGVGLFPTDSGSLHRVVEFIAFLSAAVSAILAARILRRPLSYLSILFGVVSLTALGLFVSDTFLGLGKGGMERMIVYPVITWGIGFGGYLLGMAHSKEPPAAS